MRTENLTPLHQLDARITPPENVLPSQGQNQNIHQYSTQDAYTQSCTITAWQQLYDQVSPGHFRGELQELLLDGIQLCHEYTNLALRQSCMVWPGSFWFGVPSTQQSMGFIDAQPLDEYSIAVSPGGKEFELSTPDEFSILGVVISHDVLNQYVGALNDPEWLTQRLSQGATLQMEHDKKTTLCSFIRQALWYSCHFPHVMKTRNAEKVLKHNLLTTLISFLENVQPTSEHAQAHHHRKLISFVREYVLSQTSEPVTVLDLCRQLHVSRRTLQNAFHSVVGIGPNAWLKIIRLNAVRRELISPISPHRTVQDAAMQWGFWHLSQFARDYQKLFNEKPSLTLRRRLQH
ncbi:ethanolamine utilization protein EutR [Pectobacterium actinidiae]|uniref:Ethanolamine utilization protein EutR n=1 Tax=Pectobacterium actinidiae TaxID=1507808 RepID=A0A1V2R4P2_9GAMM|nr:HTH-type transcriptional regulator EutR [Pectobacterium actinidiae]KHN93235.1 transcriptional regulator EutR [Pectobacterium actinidiae]ONK06512.1 ethanolamine utilization protein EutR [Pectobacterium actinidiae]ONK06585.1 ethanolamine utilization protein EutR [Pectobacterium actinidiae]